MSNPNKRFTIFDAVEAAFAENNVRQTQTENQLEELVSRSERSGVAFSVRQYTLADAPTAADDMVGYAVGIITDGRKPGEGAGNGTGVMAMYDVASDSWLRTSDYSAVQI